MCNLDVHEVVATSWNYIYSLYPYNLYETSTTVQVGNFSVQFIKGSHFFNFNLQMGIHGTFGESLKIQNPIVLNITKMMCTNYTAYIRHKFTRRKHETLYASLISIQLLTKHRSRVYWKQQ